MQKTEIDWIRLGRDLRESAMDAHDGELPKVEVAYSFLLDNPECFMGSTDEYDRWPKDMPAEPNIELIAAYYGAI